MKQSYGTYICLTTLGVATLPFFPLALASPLVSPHHPVGRHDPRKVEEQDPLAELEALERDEEVEAQAARVAGTTSREWILSPGANPTTTTGDAASIQFALDGAQEGDVITLTAGTYRVNLRFPRKMITLRGDPSVTQQQVILDGSGCVRGPAECSVITFDWSNPLGAGTTAEVRGLTIQGGEGRKYSGVVSTSGTYGGGVWSKNGDMEMEEVTLSGNSATSDGGGMYLYSSSPSLSQVSLSQNSSGSDGGGMSLDTSSPTLSQVTLSGNNSESKGGGMSLSSSSPTLSYVAVSGNRADDDGGGMYLSYSSPIFTQVTVSDNSAAAHGGGMFLHFCSSPLSQVSLSGNDASHGGGIYLYSSSLTLSQVSISGNSVTAYGGGMYLESSSPSLLNVSLSGNSAASAGGGITLDYSSPTFTHVSLSNNSGLYGGGMYLSSSSPTLSQVSLSGNEAGFGGGIYLDTSSPSLSQVSISGNSAAANGGGMYLSSSSPKLHNSIVAHNSASTGATVYRDSSSSSHIPTFTNTLLYPVSGNSVYNVTAPSAPFNQNPLFVDDALDGTTTDDNYHLQVNSPARDVGATTGCFNPATATFNAPCADPDGSLPDLGAWGGPGADEWDGDGDGAPAPWWPIESGGCPAVGTGYDTDPFDCNDNDGAISPDAIEVSGDGIDNNCNGLIDEGEGAEPEQDTCESPTTAPTPEPTADGEVSPTPEPTEGGEVSPTPQPTAGEEVSPTPAGESPTLTPDDTGAGCGAQNKGDTSHAAAWVIPLYFALGRRWSRRTTRPC